MMDQAMGRGITFSNEHSTRTSTPDRYTLAQRKNVHIF